MSEPSAFVCRRVNRGGPACLLGCLAFLLLGPGARAAAVSDAHPVSGAPAALRPGFELPPHGARPQVWWHWLSGNVSRAGIRKDLAWMHRIGVGGLDQIDVSFFTPRVVKHPVTYMSTRWKRDFRLATRLAARYRMAFSIDSSPGWSETGGPWVQPAEAMKKLVWTATLIPGGRRFYGVLPLPPGNTGPLQNAPLKRGLVGSPKFSHLRFYRDALVIAYKAPVLDPQPRLGWSSAGTLGARALAQLADGSLTGGVRVSSRKGRSWLQVEYPRLERLQGVTLAASVSGGGKVAATLYASTDGRTWRRIATPGGELVIGQGFPQVTVSFAPLGACYVRVALRALPAASLTASIPFHAPGVVNLSAMFGSHSRHPPTFVVHELALHARATVNEFEAKSDFRIAPDYYALASKAPIAPGTAVNPKDVVNLTGRMQPDGTLSWTPPPGDWVVLRMGYSLEGTTNHPAGPASTGLEVDKLSRTDVRGYMTHYLDSYRIAAGPFGPGSITGLTMDSSEVGMQNWTPNLLEDFRRLRGYDPIPWLPALTGVVVGNPAESDAFLWDFRRTINDLLATNHYEEIARIARAHGLTTYGEALESHRPTFGDDMRMRQYDDVPMGAMWMYPAGGKPAPTYVADLRGAASVAHVYGQNLVGAESLDSVLEPWAYAPRELKPVIDREFTLGVNRVMIHESAEQPLDNPPGLELPDIGQMFNRLDTWADEAGPWMRYIARCSYLLEQGHYVADIAYFYGQEAPITGLFGDKPIDVPEGYGFDFVDPNALKHVIGVRNGRLVTPSGMSYRVLYLGGSSRWMTLGVLRRIDQLVRQGAILVGRRPLGSPSLRDNTTRFQALAQALFGAQGSTRVHHVGRGTVFPAGSLPQALKALALPPDFEYTQPQHDTKLRYIHRRLEHGDIYFISNRRDRSERLTTSLRVTGRIPELWNPVTGAISPVSYRSYGDRTLIPLRLAPYGSVFVVFGKRATRSSLSIPSVQRRTLLRLRGPWRLAFQPRRGAPPGLTLPHLASWSVNRNPGIKYFSGTGTYTRSFRLPPEGGRGRWVLDLGAVRDIARVSVNGKSVAVLWTPPYRTDITRYVHPGINDVSVAVTDLWVNRLIGDQQPGVTHQYTFTTLPTYRPDAPLRISGLLGPVRLERVLGTHVTGSSPGQAY